MKKINVLLGALYTNALLLVIMCSYFIGSITGSHFVKDTSNIYKQMPLMFLIWFVLFLAIALINVISLVKNIKDNDKDLLFKKMKKVKIGLIPYWIINFICYLPISTLLILAGHGFGFFVVAIFIFLSYLVLLYTSVFSIAYLMNLGKNNLADKYKIIIHIMLQLFFVIDTIDTIYIIKKWGKEPVEPRTCNPTGR